MECEFEVMVNTMKITAVWWFVGLFGMIFFSPLIATPFDTPDTLKILAIRVEFQADDDDNTTGNGKFDLSQNSESFRIDPPPHNRSYFEDHLKFARNYFYRSSRGALEMTYDVFPREQNSAYQLDAEMSNYNPNTSVADIDVGIARLLRDALEKADADPAIDFSQYQSVIVFHAGVGRDVDFGFDETPQDIPSLFITSQFLSRTLGVDGIAVEGGSQIISNGIILPETESQEGIQLGLNGILVSNLGSQLGFLDLFSPETRRSGVGRFALMDAGLFNGDGLIPSLPMAWTRIDAGWETPIRIQQAQDEQVTIHGVLTEENERIYKVPISEKEYFLLENRVAGEVSIDSIQAVLSDQRGELVSMREILETNFPDQVVFSDSTGVLVDVLNPDIGLPGGGVLIWHIDERVIEANRAENRINADPDFRGVDLEEADGSQDIGAEFDFLSGGAGSELGTSLDLWFEDNSAPLFAEEAPVNEFSISSIPGSQSNYNRANSHITIKNFSKRGTSMTFTIDVNFFQPNFPAAVSTARYGQVQSLKAADFDGNGAEELLLTTSSNKLLIVDEDRRSDWGSDSLEVLQLPGGLNLQQPPAIGNEPNANNMFVVTLAGSGEVFGHRFNRSTSQLDSLFFFSTSKTITTHPVINEDLQSVYWGTENGVSQLAFHNNAWEITELSGISESVRAIQFAGDNSLIAVGSSGQVYANGTAQGQMPANAYSPAGSNAVTINAQGQFSVLGDPTVSSPEEGIHTVDAPFIAVTFPRSDGQAEDQFSYIANGNNQIYAFNSNLTLRSEFPVKVYPKIQENDLFLSPLSGVFPSHDNVNDAGIVVCDPAGMLVGYDVDGRMLPDFPLAAGDSVIASPALLDIDGDGDQELACVTISGGLLIWDFPSGDQNNNFALFSWSQQYGSPGNINRLSTSPGNTPASGGDALLAEAYNWPNPNNDNYTFIRYRLTDNAEVAIKIFDIAGDLVQEFSGPGVGNSDNEVRWDLSNVQSGVYIGRIQADVSGRNEVKIIKIAVVK